MENVELFIQVIHETDDALLVDDGTKRVWLPTSQIYSIEEEREGYATIEIPEWLAEKKGLI